jgi:hypothetical protein
MDADVGYGHVIVVIDKDIGLRGNTRTTLVTHIRTVARVDHTGWIAPCTTS